MTAVRLEGGWYVVTLNGEIVARFVYGIDAHRFAIGMLQDGIVDSVTLVSGVKVGS